MLGSLSKSSGLLKTHTKPTKTNKPTHNPKTWCIFNQEEYQSFQRRSLFIAIEVTGMDHAA